jgi:hypothetical protein
MPDLSPQSFAALVGRMRPNGSREWAAYQRLYKKTYTGATNPVCDETTDCKLWGLRLLNGTCTTAGSGHGAAGC